MISMSMSSNAEQLWEQTAIKDSVVKERFSTVTNTWDTPVSRVVLSKSNLEGAKELDQLIKQKVPMLHKHKFVGFMAV